MVNSSPSHFQQEWEQAQSRLQVLRDSLSNFPHATPRVLRVGQLDAELLDQELLQIFLDPLSKALGLIQSSYRSRFEPELRLLVRLVLYKYSVWDLGATYGARLQNLRYKDTSKTIHMSFAPSGLPRRTLCCHAALTILIPYIHARLRVYALSRAWPDAPSSDFRRKGWEALAHMESANSVLSLASFIVFLIDGRYRTWADRLLRLRLVPSQRSSTREVSYEFMNRQMVWHAFTEFLLFLLPLINTRVLRRRIMRIISKISFSHIMPSFAANTLGIHGGMTVNAGETDLPKQGKYWSLPEDQCAICVEDATLVTMDHHRETTSTSAVPSSSVSHEPSRYPIYTPYMSSCGHVYCYVCLSERMLRAADDGEPAWECLRCKAMVRNAERVEGGLVSGDFSSSDHLDMDSLESEDFISTLSE